VIDLNWIRSLIELMRESDIDTVEVSRFGSRVRVSKSPPVQMAAGDLAAASPTLGQPANPSGSGATAVGELAEVEVPSNWHDVTSPMVGTFYRSPAPDAPSYVEVGDSIGRGQTLCILEAMKLMNELESEIDGTIREICVENAEPVEYGQILFRVETSAS
jgi:acetyl-CoA carboxylase biotin carboxyl carrier protein